MSRLADTFLAQALAPNTQNSYKNKYKLFKCFCRHNYLPYLPLQEDTLVLFVTYLAARGLQVSSIRIYLSALKYYSIVKSHPFSFLNMERLYYTLRGIKRSSNVGYRQPRLPITLQHLIIIHTRLQSFAMNRLEFCLFWAACTLAFFGLLRVSEYTTPKVREFDFEVHLLSSDITFCRNTLLVKIKASKTDPFKLGCQLTIGPANGFVCPVAAMRAFLRYRSPDDGPLFTFTDGTYLTRNRMYRLLLACFQDNRINTHSFRIGGATALSQAGVPDSQIQSLGRWNSNCFVRYLRLPSQTVSAFSSRMSDLPVDSYFWDGDSQG